MNNKANDVVTIAARISAQDLAEAIDREVGEITGVLSSMGEPDGRDDFLSGQLAVDVAASLGVQVEIEPRDLALEHLYTLESHGEIAKPPGGRAGHLVRGVADRLDELDAVIEGAAEHWSVARMPAVDRNILRIGVFELQYEPQTPTPVVVSEAVRLAQTYSTERSGSFVNGVLAAVAKEVR